MRSGGRWSSVGRRQGVSRPLGWAGGGGFDTPLRGYSTHGGALRGYLHTQPAGVGSATTRPAGMGRQKPLVECRAKRDVSRPIGWRGGFDTPLRGYSTHGAGLRGHLRTQPAEGVLCADPTGGDGTAEPVGRVPREARCIETARVGAWQRGIRRCAATQPAGVGALRGYPQRGMLRGYSTRGRRDGRTRWSSAGRRPVYRDRSGGCVAAGVSIRRFAATQPTGVG
jgi:hypothetical protein